MRGYYGVMTGLAIAFGCAATVAAQPGEQAPNLPKVRKDANVEASPLTGPVVRTATVRQASVTTVNNTPQPGLSAVTKAVEDYFNGISTLQANFTQTVTGERTASAGVFSWRRPGQFLWQYQTPVAQKLVSTGSAIYFIDDRQQATQLPMDAGVARLFNAKSLNLSKQGLRATHVKTTSQRIEVDFAVDKKIATGDQTGLASLKLVFDRMPGNRMQLRQIDALDTLSVTTRVEFSNLRENVSLPAKMFAFTPGVYEQRN